MARTRNDQQLMEGLEARTLLSAVIDGEVLVITGTDQADAIVIEAGANDGEVRVSGVEGVADGTTFQNVNRLLASLGAGDDSFTINGEIRNTAGDLFRTAVFGNNGNDTLIGGTTVDTLYGGLGDDTLRGGQLNDRIFGGAGDDTIFGNRGRDQIFAGAGDDEVFGGTQRDRINGGSGVDTIFGNLGNDEINAGTGNDIVRSGNGRDTVFGGEGFDDINGGFGNDRLFGGADGDLLRGNFGNDELFSGDDSGDAMRGGAGSDAFFGSTATISDPTAQDRGFDFDNPISSFDNDLDSSFWDFAAQIGSEYRAELPESFADLAVAARGLNDAANGSLSSLFDLASTAIGVQITSDFVPFGEAGSGVVSVFESMGDTLSPLVTDFDQDGAIIDYDDIASSLDLMLILLPQQQQSTAISLVSGVVQAETEFRAFESAFDSFLSDVQSDSALNDAIASFFTLQLS